MHTMNKSEKRRAAAVAAIAAYLQEEQEAADAAAAMAASAAAPRRLSDEPGAWAQSGRMDMMTGRRLMQLRAFSNAR